ncbi:hypothetical protein BU16DRAFT_538465 [Lophium mytilinum]|uniref:Uncharacterized protein n=1 Tax=Lophium mytilinum TaxID=390894 RepID=A0A6A6QUG9_9PEZI|nr:hypothetical protein BU16DRAFT_538465 [Lophium mytilinum]
MAFFNVRATYLAILAAILPSRRQQAVATTNDVDKTAATPTNNVAENAEPSGAALHVHTSGFADEEEAPTDSTATSYTDSDSAISSCSESSFQIPRAKAAYSTPATSTSSAESPPSFSHSTTAPIPIKYPRDHEAWVYPHALEALRRYEDDMEEAEQEDHERLVHRYDEGMDDYGTQKRWRKGNLE